jgi:mRNA interferase RelE/StbE
MFDVVLSPEAKDFFAAADRSLARKLARCFGQLEADPRHHNNIRRLKGELNRLFRYRVGEWRVIYRIDDGRKQVQVLTIAHRSEAYD